MKLSENIFKLETVNSFDKMYKTSRLLFWLDFIRKKTMTILHLNVISEGKEYYKKKMLIICECLTF